jgi:apolipoprotein D and lipocalin family protein
MGAAPHCQGAAFPWPSTRLSHYILLYVGCAVLSGCAAAPRAPIRTEPQVDLQRFMGDWYVIANIPTFLERDAYNAVESYKLDDDGTIATTFTFRSGGFDGDPKRYTPRGFVLDTQSNSVWGMQFVWPFKGDYRIVYVNDDYSQTAIGREKRDYVWIMARTPAIPEADYQSIVTLLAAEGYDITKIRKVPQRWDDKTK